MPTFFDLVKEKEKKKEKPKIDKKKEKLLKDLAEIINSSKKKSKLSAKVKKESKSFSNGGPRITAWMAGAMYEFFTQKSIRGTRGKILAALVKELLAFMKENEPEAYQEIKSHILNNIE